MAYIFSRFVLAGFTVCVLVEIMFITFYENTPWKHMHLHSGTSNIISIASDSFDTVGDMLEMTLTQKINREMYEMPEKVLSHRKKLLSAIEYEQRNFVFKMNPYKVPYRKVIRPSSDTKVRDLLCSFKNIPLSTLKSSDEEVKNHSQAKWYPTNDIFHGRHFKSCAIVSSAYTMKGSKLGKEIDDHELVARLNDAPTEGYEEDVGRKTTLRVVNAYYVSVLSRGNFNKIKMFNEADNLMLFDVPSYTQNLKQWFVAPEFPNFIPIYIDRMKRNLTLNSFILHPWTVWDQYEVMRAYANVTLPYKPPTSGFMTALLLMSACDYVDLYEFIPSTRMINNECYYYRAEKLRNYCLSNDHPLATEKKFLLYFNLLDPVSTFVKGVSRIPGFNRINCH